jgi:putative ABC transport system permease protein
VRKNLTKDDAAAIARLCPAVATVSPEVWQGRRISYGQLETRNIGIVGGTEEFFATNNWSIGEGRPLSADDVRHSSAFCVLGTAVTDQLFPSGGAIGARVRVGSDVYVVIGVLASRGKFLGQNQDEIAVVPLARLARTRGSGNAVDHIVAAARSPALAEAASEQIEELLRRRRGVRSDQENDFGITSQENLLQIYKQITQGFFLVMVLISSIGLMVGGIGVMNMMLVSVRERTREIGLRMAVGCRRRDLLGQFLVEASVLTGCGGVIGIALGQLFALLLSLVLPVPAGVSLPWVIAAVAVSASIGLFFGIYPAWRASRLDPVEALRYE